MATVICPNCGGENDVTKRSDQECAYCGTMLHLPTPTEPKTRKKKASASTKELSEAKYIVPIAAKYAKKEEVVKALEAYLVKEDNVPEDIFDHIEVKSVKWLYLPMWRFNGDLSTEWSCDEVIYKKRKVGERPIYDSKGNFERMEVEYETYEDYLPKSGHGHATFDILVPAIKKIKEKLPYIATDFNKTDTNGAVQLKSDTKPTPLSASMRKCTLEVDSESVLTDVTLSLRVRAEKCSYGGLYPRSSHLPLSIIKGRECIHENCNFTYRFNENGTVGELYYIPFVYVVYSYKDGTHDWGFAINPNNAGYYDLPEVEDNLVDDERNSHEEELKQVEKKWTWSIALSFVFSLVIGCVIFFCLNNSLYERVKKRLENQRYMISLRGKYQRRDNLIKRGADKKTIADINSEIDEEYGFDDYDTEDDKTPKSIAEIDEFYATTDVLKKKFLKRINLFWVWYIALIVIAAGGILGYNYWDGIQKEKMWAEEQAAYEAVRKAEIAKQQELEATQRAEMEQAQRESQKRLQQKQSEILNAFHHSFIGKTFQSTGWSNSYNRDETIYEFWRITFIDKEKAHFEKQSAEADYELQDDNWQTVSTAPYHLEFHLKENEYVDNVFEGNFRLVCDGFEGEIKIYRFNDPIKISNSFTLVKGERELRFYID